MKKNLFVVMAAMTLVIAMAAGAYAATTPATVNATANVIAGPGSCSIGGAITIAFGNVDEMTHAGGATAVVTPTTVYCTNLLPVVVTDDLGANESGAQMRLTDGANFINYSISYDNSLTGGGMATDIGGTDAGDLNVGATMPAGALTSKPVGNYTDTVVLTFTY
jgi:spore coat protein U-like protein